TMFVSRILESLTHDGTAALVLPQYWLFLSRYTHLRKDLLRNQTWDMLATLGPGAFKTISGEVVNTCLVSLSRAVIEDGNEVCLLDALQSSGAAGKADYLQHGDIEHIRQVDQLKNPDA